MSIRTGSQDLTVLAHWKLNCCFTLEKTVTKICDRALYIASTVKFFSMQFASAVASCWPWTVICNRTEMPPYMFFLEQAGFSWQVTVKLPDVITGRSNREETFCVSKEMPYSESLHIWLTSGSRFFPSANLRNAFTTLHCLARIKHKVSSWTRLILGTVLNELFVGLLRNKFRNTTWLGGALLKYLWKSARAAQRHRQPFQTG